MLLQPAAILHPRDARRADRAEVRQIGRLVLVVRSGQHAVTLDQCGIRALQLHDDRAELLAFVQLDRKFEAAIAVAELCLEQILTETVHLAAADTAPADKGQDQLVANRVGARVDPACDPVLLRDLYGPTDHHVP